MTKKTDGRNWVIDFCIKLISGAVARACCSALARGVKGKEEPAEVALYRFLGNSITVCEIKSWYIVLTFSISEMLISLYLHSISYICPGRLHASCHEHNMAYPLNELFGIHQDMIRMFTSHYMEPRCYTYSNYMNKFEFINISWNVQVSVSTQSQRPLTHPIQLNSS